MAYNIDSIDYISGSLSLSPGMRTRLLGELGDERPEGCFLDEARCWQGQRLRWPWWHGVWSGHCWDSLKRVLAAMDGAADFVVCWEGGDSYTGLRVVDGTVTEHEVVHALGEPI